MARSSDTVDRRVFLGLAATTGALAVASCSGPERATSSASSSQVTHKRGGTLRLASSTGAGTDLDPHGTGSLSSVKGALYDSLVSWTHDMKLVNDLADTFEADDDTFKTWTIRVRRGVTWHDGKPVTSDDVEFTIRRIADPENPRAAAALLSDIDLDKIQKIDDRTLRLHLKRGNSQLHYSFTPSFSSIVPVGFDPKKPIGTGPFMHVAFTPRQRWSGKRYADYWRVKHGAYLDKLEVVGFANGTAAFNALLAGQVDALPNVLPSQLAQVSGHPKITHVESQTGFITQVGMNCRKGQDFEDPRVRQAFRLIFDRKQLVATVYAGHGEVGGNDVGVFSQWDPAVAPGLTPRKQNIAKAKELLKAAGKAGMRTTMRVGDRVPGMVKSAQVMQQQAKDAGVTIDLDIVNDPNQYYTKSYFTAQMQMDYTTTGSMFGTAYYYMLSTADYNSGGYHNPTVDRLFQEAVTLPPDGYIAKMRDMSKILYDEGPWVVWGRQNIIDLFKKNIVGVHEDAGGEGLNGNKFWNISLA